MKYYVTIYIDKLFEKEMFKDVDFTLLAKREFSAFLKQIDFTHAFLGLTRKHPDELDKQDEETRKEKLKNADWKDFDAKWYESLETNEFNDGFYGFGSATSLGKMIGDNFTNNDSIGKVFEE